MLTFSRNGDLLSKAGTIIYINRPFEDCYNSLMKNPDRPLMKNNTKEELLDRYNKRAVSYQAYAAFTVKKRPDSFADCQTHYRSSFLRFNRACSTWSKAFLRFALGQAKFTRIKPGAEIQPGFPVLFLWHRSIPDKSLHCDRWKAPEYCKFCWQNGEGSPSVWLLH